MSDVNRTEETLLKPGEPNHCRFCGSPYSEIDRMAAKIERLHGALEIERQRYMSLADRQAKRGKDEAAQELWDKAEAIAKVLKS